MVMVKFSFATALLLVAEISIFSICAEATLGAVPDKTAVPFPLSFKVNQSGTSSAIILVSPSGSITEVFIV